MAMHRNKSADVHQFAMIPKAEIPRSSFRREFTHKTTFDENYLVPVYVDEVLPGDTFSLRMTAFARLTTPIYPVMDNMYLDSFFFFVPCRLIWQHWVNFMGEQPNGPGDSISYTIPVCNPTGSYAINSLQDYMGLPTTGSQITSAAWSHSALPFRAYNKIWNDWFRDENLQNAAWTQTDDGPDLGSNYPLLKRGKRHDYFTSCLPWTQKGGVAVTLPLGTSAPVRGIGWTHPSGAVGGPTAGVFETGGGSRTYANNIVSSTTPIIMEGSGSTTNTIVPTIFADLTAATAATINQLRQSFQIQKLLERDARGGTRYTEIIRSHFGVVSPDARLQRTEYLGGGTVPVNIAPIAQTSASNLTGGTTPLGNLAAFGTMLAQGHGFTQSFTEHGYVIGLVNIRADQTYQQGLRKMWSRSTRYDFYFPAFAMLGEQPVLNQEIYIQATAADATAFGYQERWAEYRYLPSMVTGNFRSTVATPLDAWHLAEKFTSLPTLGATFIQANAPVSRISAVASPGTHFIFDGLFSVKTTRPMPLYSVPGLIDHF